MATPWSVMVPLYVPEPTVSVRAPPTAPTWELAVPSREAISISPSTRMKANPVVSVPDVRVTPPCAMEVRMSSPVLYPLAAFMVIMPVNPEASPPMMSLPLELYLPSPPPRL